MPLVLTMRKSRKRARIFCSFDLHRGTPRIIMPLNCAATATSFADIRCIRNVQFHGMHPGIGLPSRVQTALAAARDDRRVAKPVQRSQPSTDAKTPARDEDAVRHEFHKGLL